MSAKPIRNIVFRPEMTKPRSPIGLGDAIAVVAQPIARAIDRAIGTDIEHCGGCAKRHASLNKAFPNINPFK